MSSSFDESPAHVASDEVANGLKDLPEVLKEVKGGRHGVKRKSRCCEARRAALIARRGSQTDHDTMRHCSGTHTRSVKSLADPAQQIPQYASGPLPSPLQSTTPGRQVGGASLGAPFQVFLIWDSCY
jgi:hypothetical protein